MSSSLGPDKKRIQAYLPANLAKAARVYADQWDMTFEEFTRECFETHVIAHSTCCKDSDWIIKANNLELKANHEKPCYGYCCRACKHKGEPCKSGEYQGCWEAAPGIEAKIKPLSKKQLLMRVEYYLNLVSYYKTQLKNDEFEKEEAKNYAEIKQDWKNIPEVLASPVKQITRKAI